MKNFINIQQIQKKDLRKILNDAKKRKLKRKKLNTLSPDTDIPLKDKLLVQIFERSSLRTRLSFYLAIKQLGGSAITLKSEELHLKKGGESLQDTAKILSTYADLFMIRTNNEEKLNILSRNLSIPLINGLSPESHPAQILSDIFTIEEIKRKPINKLNISWIGDSNNVLNSLIEASAKFSFKLLIGCPKEFMPSKKIIEWAKKNSTNFKIYNDPKKALYNADVLLTDKVISMNDKVDKKKKSKKFKNFKITNKLIKYGKKNLTVLHCLPRGDEIDEKVFNKFKEYIWKQAHNRICVQKSILLYCLGKLR